MKKITRLSISLLFVFFMMVPAVVQAYTIQYQREDYNYVPSIRNYYATIGSEQYMAYCLDPGLKWGHGKNPGYFSSIRPINPSIRTVGSPDYIYDLAFTYAYQKMKENGWATTTNDFGSSSSSPNRVIGTTAFRLIQMALVNGGKGRGYTSGVYSSYQKYLNGGAGLSAKGNGMTYINAGKNLAAEAINFAVSNANTDYEEVMKQLKLSSWDVVSTTMSPVSGSNNYELKIEIQPSSTNIKNIRFSDFKVGFVNTTAKIVSQSTVQGANNHAISTVVFDGSTWDKQDLGAYIDTYYCDIYSASSNLFVLQSGSSKNQNMIIVTDSNCTSTTGNPHGGGRRRIPTSGKTCSCDHSTGYFTYQEIKDGKVIVEKKWQDGTPIPDGVDKSYCDDSCPIDRRCSTNNNKYYCSYDKNNDGLGDECSKEEYTSDCLKPVCSIDDQGQHYCNDHDGDGGGDKCDADQYQTDCECPKLEKDCENDPNSPSCDEYDKKCINCNPTVTVPADCSDLQDYNVDIYHSSYKDGSISDISRVPTQCNNNKVNSVKSCVLGKVDAAGESYESKEAFQNIKTSETSQNRYCKVWCDEVYNFDLPTAQRTVSGGYFTLHLSVEGKRTCYTSSARDSEQPIDYALFSEDIEKARREVIDAWNDYNYWKTAVASDAKTTPHTAAQGTCTSSCTVNGQPSQCSTPGAGPKDYNVVTLEWNALQYTYEGGQTSKAGSYSDGSGSCGCSSCDVHNGHDPRYADFDGQESYSSRRDKAKAVLDQKIQKFNEIIDEFNSCSGNMSGKTGWSNDMKFNPEITFSYNEGYLDKDDELGKFVKVSNESTDDTLATYCDGDTDRQYNCKSAAATQNDNNVPSSMQYTQQYVMCEESGCHSMPYVLSRADWVKKEKVMTQGYRSGGQFSTYTQYGTIRKNANGQYELYTPLPDGAFPISLIQKTGVFPFTITFDKIGQSNVDGTLGRLIGKNYKTTGGKADILTAFNELPAQDKCDISGNKNENFESATTSSGYVCHYINNCDDCEFDCEDDDCSFSTDCTDCQFFCDTCIFDGKNTTYSYRTVSLNSLFPNERPVGFNWKNTIKGEVTRREIEMADQDESPESIYKTPQYSFTLTPANLNKIREYNDKVGSYTNATIPEEYVSRVGGSDSAVYCETETYPFNDITYSVRCRSRFLDIIEATGNQFATDVYRITSEKEQAENAWELFTSHPTCLNGSCLQKGIGPSWRLRSVNK